jgi:hypothetical protein
VETNPLLMLANAPSPLPQWESPSLPSEDLIVGKRIVWSAYEAFF